MLGKADRVLFYLPSRVINSATMGSKGSSLCGRLYLYREYMDKENKLVNFLITCIDGLEKGHCETAARHWRIRHKKEKCYFPDRYREYLSAPRNPGCNTDTVARLRRAQYGFDWVDGPENLRAAMMLEA